jgi:hypothetical protein
MICVYCKKREVTGGAGPIDACNHCKMEFAVIGRMMQKLPEKAAHVIMGAIATTESEGISHMASGQWVSCEDHFANEVVVIRFLNELYPDVVKQYAHLGSVKEVLA